MDTWSGPAVLTSIRGTPDSAVKQETDYKKPDNTPRVQIALALVDVVQTYDDGSVQELPARTLFIATEGEPAAVFAAGVRKVLEIPPKVDGKKTDILGPLLGCSEVTFGVSEKPWANKKTGQKGTMTLYILEKATRGKAVPDVIGFLVGKTPAEVAKGKSVFAGTDVVANLVSRTRTLAAYGSEVELVDGVYQAKQEETGFDGEDKPF